MVMAVLDQARLDEVVTLMSLSPPAATALRALRRPEALVPATLQTMISNGDLTAAEAAPVKGPLRTADGTPVTITDDIVEGLAKSVLNENHSTASKAIGVDTMDLSVRQFEAVQRIVNARLTSNKPIIYLR